jgi:DNA-directed RNA polymerase specialized sigma24 family protein
MDDRTETDEALLHRIAEGDRSAFPVLYRRHLDAVIAFVMRRVPEPDLAFDVAAERSRPSP